MVKWGQKGVCDGPIQKITSGSISTGQKTIPDTPIMSILSMQNYGVTLRGKSPVSEFIEHVSEIDFESTLNVVSGDT